MSQRHCIRHTDRPAIGNCFQCHKPICGECRYEGAADGLFCSRECYDAYLAYQSRKQPVVKRGRLKSLVVGLLVLAVVGAGAIFIGGGLGLPVLRPIRDAILSLIR